MRYTTHTNTTHAISVPCFAKNFQQVDLESLCTPPDLLFLDFLNHPTLPDGALHPILTLPGHSQVCLPSLAGPSDTFYTESPYPDCYCASA